MNQQSRNKLFVENKLMPIFESLNKELSKDLIDRLNCDKKKPLSDIMDNNMKRIDDQSVKIMFILMQYTKERDWTEYLAKIFVEMNQDKLAKKLLKYNKTESFKDYDDVDALTVRPAISNNKAPSMCYIMAAKPRGMCLIINNEMDLNDEAQAFKKVISQLHFKVNVYRNHSAEQIRQLFTTVANKQTYQNMDAIITIFIGHGRNDNLLGHYYDKKENPGDLIRIYDLVDIFSDKDGQPFKDKPKIHLFNCCRKRTKQFHKEIDLDKYFDQNWTNKNLHTTIIYGCAEGHEAKYEYEKEDNNGWSFFGRAFIHTLAQFAHEYNFDQIINKTNYRLKLEGKGQYTPQIVKQLCQLNLYFNPGFFKDNIQMNQ